MTWLQFSLDTTAARVEELEDLMLATGAVAVDALGVVFNDLEIVLLGDIPDGGHVRALTIEVYRDDGLGLFRDGRGVFHCHSI